MDNEQIVETFGCGLGVGEATPEIVGNKAANLMRMSEVGLPVPPGFVLTTSLCRNYFDNGGRLSEKLRSVFDRNIAHLERATGLSFGGSRRPLLVSVRSGAPVSMPGMMDTILNVGLCEQTLSPLIRMTGNPRFVWDSYRRLIQTFGEVVRGLPADPFELLLDDHLKRQAVPAVNELDVFELRELTQEFLRLYAKLNDEPFPQEPSQQLEDAVHAVFRSWRSPRAIEYRRMHSIAENLGTAVTIQAMVFGNLGSTSGSGVAFTRDPTTGKNEMYLDFLWNAQGEDVVSGRHAIQEGSTIRRLMPMVDSQLQQVRTDLERIFLDVQDFEFTVQEGQLYLLQSRTAKRTPWAALQIACDLVNEGLINVQVALERLDEYDLDSLEMIRLARCPNQPPLSVGVAACPGVAVGPIAFDSPTAIAMARNGSPPILLRHDMSTDDVAGMAASAGMLTALGGRTSHAAVVARQMNKVCIVGCPNFVIERGRQCRIGTETFSENDFLSLDGHTGAVFSGQLDVVVEKPKELLSAIEKWKQAQLRS